MKANRSELEMLSLLNRFQRKDVIPMPNVQRELVWDTKRKKGLIDSVLNGYYFGELLFHEEDGVLYIVDGQQRLTTLFTYKYHNDPLLLELPFPNETRSNWAKKKDKKGFIPYDDLTPLMKKKFDESLVPICILTNCSKNEAAQQFRRLQLGKALKAGDQIFASIYSDWHPYVKQLTETDICKKIEEETRTRAQKWVLAAYFLSIAIDNNIKIQDNLSGVESILDQCANAAQLQEATERTERLMGYVYDMDAILLKCGGIRYKKWCTRKRVTVLYNLIFLSHSFNKTHVKDVSDTLIRELILPMDDETTNLSQVISKEENARSLDVHRTSLQEVFAPIRLLIWDIAPPRDEKRFFSPSEKMEIFAKYGGKCAECKEALLGSWEADHILPYAAGWRTTVDNGQPLCVPCHRKKHQSVHLMSASSI